MSRRWIAARLGRLCIMGAAIAAGDAALAGPERLRLTDASAWGGFFAGGPYEVQPTNFGFAPGGVGQHGANAGHFITFAVEASGDLWEGPFQYQVGFSEAAVGNGVGGGNPDELDDRTAYLYTTFLSGQLTAKLASFNGSNFAYGQAASGSALQDAIWNIEQEIGNAVGLAASLVALADAAVANGGEWFGKGIGDVLVMNITDAGGYAFQDLLVLRPTQVPLPAPLASGLVGVVGMMGWTRLRRLSCQKRHARPREEVVGKRSRRCTCSAQSLHT